MLWFYMQTYFFKVKTQIERTLHLPFLMLGFQLVVHAWHGQTLWEVGNAQHYQAGQELAVFAITCSNIAREIALASNHRCLLRLKTGERS